MYSNLEKYKIKLTYNEITRLHNYMYQLNESFKSANLNETNRLIYSHHLSLLHKQILTLISAAMIQQKETVTLKLYYIDKVILSFMFNLRDVEPFLLPVQSKILANVKKIG